MSNTPERARGRPDEEPAERIRRVCQQFIIAWEETVKGGPRPSIARLLENIPELERPALRTELQKIELAYQQHDTPSRGRPGDATIQFEPTAAPRGAPGGEARSPDLNLRSDLSREACASADPAREACASADPDSHPDLATEDGTILAAAEGETAVRGTLDLPPPAAGASATSDGEPSGFDFSLGEGVQFTAVPERPRVANHEILGELGRGGMGVVYKARQTRLNRLVALKMLLAGGHASREQLARFYTEAQAIAGLTHPNIVQVYEVGDQDGLPYFSLEFVEGGSLSDRLRGKPQPPGPAAELLQTLARAMHYAHQHGLLHRDLKPANILLTDNGTPKITDFGLAKRIEDDSSQTRTGSVMGTPGYMAPEQAWGQVHDLGPAVDIYALGAILYELLTGRPPLVGATVLETLDLARTEDPLPPSQLQPSVPRDLETVCLKCLQKEPAKRYASAGALADDLGRFLAGEPILARPVSAPERLWRWCRRNPRVAALSGLVLLLLVAVAATSTWFAITVARERDAKEREKLAAEAARDLADASAEVARQARSRADANARVAQEQANLAVKTFYQVVVELQNQLRDRPDMQKLREKLLTDALAGLNEVAKNAENSNLLLRTLGGAYQRMGDVAQELGQTTEAGRQYDRALGIFEQLAALDPADDVSKWNLAVMYEKKGTINHRLRGDVARTRDYYRKATQLREALAAGPRSEPKLTQPLVDNALAGSYAAEANLALLMGEPARARDYFQRAVKLREQLAEADGQNRQAKEGLATLYVTLGLVSFHLHDAEAAEGYYLRSLRLREALAEADPDSVPFQKALVDVHQKIGDMLLHLRGREAQGAVRQHYTTAHELQQKLFQRNPANTEMRQALAGSHYRLGTLARRSGEAAESQQQFRECLRLREALAGEDPTNLYKQVELALAQARCGEHEKAAATAGRLRAGAAEDAGILYYLGCAYALCAAAADDSALRDQYAGLALATLRQAVARGYNDRVSLETDPDLEALQPTPAYVEFVQHLQPH